MENGKALHIVMFPWLATGHLIPFFHLSKSFALKGHHVSFVSTPANLRRLPGDVPSRVNLVPLPFPRVENLPENAESSMDIPYQMAQFLKIAFDLLRSPLAEFLRTTRPSPDWIVYDYASHWLPKLADEFGVSRAYFSLFTAATMAYIGPPSALLGGDEGERELTVVPKWIPFESYIAYRPYEIMKYMESSAGNESGTSDTIRFGMAIEGCDVVLFRTCIEFEQEWYDLVGKLYQKPVVAVGVLPPSVDEEEADKDDRWLRIKDWLDKQPYNTVVYVALGTEAVLTQEELAELALGLEQCGLPFFWVLRRPPGSTVPESAMLPAGFEERVENRGVVYREWAPQVKILSHPAIGGFLTHCGWNSVIEALSLGRVLILFPVMNDQGLNSRQLHGKKVGVEIPRNAQDGSFTSASVAETVRYAVRSQEAESVRENARKARDLFGNTGIQQRYVDSSIQYLVEKRRSRN